MAQDKKEKVLIIEGDGSLAENIASALKSQGYEAIVVKNGVEGIKAIYDVLPHLIILDIVLPGMDGYEVLSQKNAEPQLTKIPVFLMSTQGVPINMQKVPKNSVTEYIVTFHSDPKEIVDKVNRHFNKTPESDEAKNSGSKRKVLWVEDDKLIGTILSKKLISSGFELFHAKNGEEALKYVADNIPDVIVLDLLLPGMGGFDILQKMKEDGRLKDVPAMILSNMNKQSDVERAKALGAKRYLVKAAFSLDQIVGEVKGLAS